MTPDNDQPFRNNAVRKKPPDVLRRLTGISSDAWRSRLGWRISLLAFAAIVLVQAAGLMVAMYVFEDQKIDKLRDVTRIYIASTADYFTPANIEDAARRIVHDSEKFLPAAEARLSGIVVYGADMTVKSVYGVLPSLRPEASMPHNRKKISQTAFDIAFNPADTGSDYYIAARLDAPDATSALRDRMHNIGMVFIALSALITCLFMMVLGRWLLDPIMLLRRNLLNASYDPETTDITPPRGNARDEIDIAIHIANDLIRQNASNLRRLRTQAEDKIHRLAYYDALTGLPNRTFFIEKLDESIRRKVEEDDCRLAVLCVDIDHFKVINDTMGHDCGDLLLETMAKRLVKAVPADALVSRASADEFSIMVVMKDHTIDVTHVIDRILAAAAAPVNIMQETFEIRVSIGVAQSPQDGLDARQVLKNADIALNRAKEDGRDTVRYYSEDLDHAIQKRFQLIRDLRIATEEEQFRLFFHPQFDLKTGAIIGAEALIRWWRPDDSAAGGSFIPPLDFIPVAEDSGLIAQIGEWVVHTACKTAKAWQDKGLPPLRVAVNISSVQFHKSDLGKVVQDALYASGLDPKYLELEITESAFMENMQKAIDVLNQLHRLGIELSVDDFGTGYSSLSYLRQFPIDRLKIDQSFVRHALINQDDRAIARTIISLGHSLNLKVMAEGVETEAHESFLRDHGCDEAQGFKYSQPLPADKFDDFVRNYLEKRNTVRELSVVASEDDN